MSKKKRRPGSVALPSLSRQLIASLAEADDLMRRKRWGEARNLLLALDQRYPRQSDVLGSLVNVYYELKDYRGYLSAIERLSRLTPNDPDIIAGLAGGYMTNIYPFLALRTYRRYLERWPAHEQGDKARQAVALLEEQAPTLLAETGLEDFELAALHDEVRYGLEYNDVARARAAAERLLKEHPDFVPVLNNLSQAEAVEGRLEPAMRTAERVLGIEPDNVHALSNLTRFLCLGGRFDEAQRPAERLKAIDTTMLDLAVKKAEALSYLGDDQGVLDAFVAARAERDLDDYPPAALLYHLAAVATMRQGREDEARRLWQQAVKLGPHLDLPRDNLADLRQPAGERHAPWPFTLTYWLPRQAAAGLADYVAAETRGSDEAVARALRRYLRQHPQLTALVPALLDRGDPAGRAFAVRMARVAQTPELLAALKEFALGQRGPDGLRAEAANAVSEAGLFEPGPVRLWQKGEWRDILLLNFELHTEPTAQHAAPVQALEEAALAALRAGKAREGERLLRQALEGEPDAPDLRHNLAAALAMQGRVDEADLLTEETYRRFPEYLFAAAGLARRYIQRGLLDEAKPILDALLTRPRYHILEYGALAQAQIDYWLRKGERESARSWFDMWAGVDPDNPALGEWRRAVGRPARRR